MQGSPVTLALGSIMFHAVLGLLMLRPFALNDELNYWLNRERLASSYCCGSTRPFSHAENRRAMGPRDIKRAVCLAAMLGVIGILVHSVRCSNNVTHPRQRGSGFTHLLLHLSI